jgi:hypothetical protein
MLAVIHLDNPIPNGDFSEVFFDFGIVQSVADNLSTSYQNVKYKKSYLKLRQASSAYRS